MMTAFASQNNGNPLAQQRVQQPLMRRVNNQPRNGVEPSLVDQPPNPPVEQPVTSNTVYPTPTPPDVFIPQQQAQQPEGTAPTTTPYPLPTAYPTPMEQPSLPANPPTDYSASLPVAYAQPPQPIDPVAYATPYYPEYLATTPPTTASTAYPSYEAYPAYPAYPPTPMPAVAKAPTKPPIGIFEKLLWGTLATVVTGVTAFAVFDNRERLFQTFPTNVVAHTKGFFNKLWQGIDGRNPVTMTTAKTPELTSLTRAIDHLLGDSKLSGESKAALKALQLKITDHPQELLSAEAVHHAFEAVLHADETLQGKVKKQLELLNVSITASTTIKQQASIFLEKFSGEQHPFSGKLRGFASKETLTNRGEWPTVLITRVEQFQQELMAAPEREAALMKLLNKRVSVIQKGVKKFDRAYENSKVSPQEQADLKNDFLKALWEKPEEAKVAQKTALEKASWWRRKTAWLPF